MSQCDSGRFIGRGDGDEVSARSIASQSSGRANRRRGMVRHALCRDRAHTFDCRRNKPGSLRREGQGAPKFAQKSAETHVALRRTTFASRPRPALGNSARNAVHVKRDGFELLESASISHSVQETSCNSLANKSLELLGFQRVSVPPNRR